MKILHLYHDIMNLYGDYANVSAVKRMAEKSGEDCTVDRLSLSDTAQLLDYNFIFIGSGTERNQKVVLEDFRKYTDQLKEFIDSGKPALLTGNAFEMLGKSITDAAGKSYDGLGFFDFTVTEQNKTRMTSDVIYQCDFLTQPLVGFVNKCSAVCGVQESPFTVKMGLSNCDGDKGEGVRTGNLIGTHLTGPVLMKNPHFLAYITEKALGRDPETAYLVYERAGYEVTLTELENRNEN